MRLRKGDFILESRHFYLDKTPVLGYIMKIEERQRRKEKVYIIHTFWFDNETENTIHHIKKTDIEAIVQLEKLKEAFQKYMQSVKHE